MSQNSVPKSYYILFPNHTEGMGLYKALRKEGFKVRISPTPRQADSCCGMSLLVAADEIENVRSTIEEAPFVIERIVELENQINPRRDVCC